MRNFMILVLLLACSLSWRALATDNVEADTAFFDGKAMTYIVPSKAGGGYDTYVRLIAGALEKHLPGLDVRVENVPGAGGLVALSRLSAATPDGLTIATLHPGIIYAQLLDLSPDGLIDIRRLSWIGKAASEARVMIVSTRSGIEDLDELRNPTLPVIFGSAGVGSTSHTEMLMLAQVLDLNVKLVTGFSGGEDEIAMLRGDTQGDFGSYSSVSDFVAAGHARVILRLGDDPSLPNGVPSAADLVRDKQGQRVVEIIETLGRVQRPTAGPEGIPPSRLLALRQAYIAALNDPELLANAAKLNKPIDPLPGDVVAELVAEALNQPDDVLEALRRLTQGAN